MLSYSHQDYFVRTDMIYTVICFHISSERDVIICKQNMELDMQ